MLVWVGVACAGAMLMLGGVSLAAWQLGFLGGSSGALTATEMRYAPDDSDVFLTLDGDAWANAKMLDLVSTRLQSRGDVAQKGKAKFDEDRKNMNDAMAKELWPGTDLHGNDFRRVFFAYAPQMEESVLVVVLRKPTTLEALSKISPTGMKQSTVGKYTVCETAVPGATGAFCLVDSTTIVGSNKLETLKTILERSRAGKISPASTALLKTVDTSKLFTLVVNGANLKPKEPKPAAPNTIDLMKMIPPEWQALTRSSGMTLEVDCRTAINMAYTLHCKDADDATSLRKLIDGELTVLRERGKQNQESAQTADQKASIQKGLQILDGLQLVSEGATIRARWAITADQLADVIETNPDPTKLIGGPAVSMPVSQPPGKPVGVPPQQR